MGDRKPVVSIGLPADNGEYREYTAKISHMCSYRCPVMAIPPAIFRGTRQFVETVSVKGESKTINEEPEHEYQC